MNKQPSQTAGPAPWWAKLPTMKLIVVGFFALGFQYGDALIEVLVLKACP